MSPLSIYRHIPTVLDLNGPTLSFTTQPTGVTTTIGLACTFTGIATVSFPAGTAIEGNISYQWYNYTDGSAVTDGNRNNSRGGISTFSGAQTTSLTIVNPQFVEDHNEEFYLEADFKPVGYWQPGNESPNPNAINDKLNSDIVKLQVPARLEIVLQPLPQLESSSSILESFNINATLTDPTLNSLIQYQWKIDGNNLTDDGENTIGARSKNLKIKRSAGTYSISCSVSHPDALPSPILSDDVAYVTARPTNTIYSQIIKDFDDPGGPISVQETLTIDLSAGPVNLVGREFNVNPDDDTDIKNPSFLNFLYTKDGDADLLIEIAAAGGSSYSGNRGGRGGWSLLRLQMVENMEYLVDLGSNNAAYSPWGGLIYTTNQNRGTYGGGGAFLYKQNRPIAVMGGGGGAGENGRGGDGGAANQEGESGGGRQGGLGGGANNPSGRDISPQGRGNDIFSPTNIGQDARLGETTAACISPDGFTDIFRNRGLSDCEAYGANALVPFQKSSDGTVVSNSAELYRGFRTGAAGRINGGWGLDGKGGAGGAGSRGGDGAISNGDGGGGGAGWADAGEVDILESRPGINAADAYMRISLYDPNAALPLPPETTPVDYTIVDWDDGLWGGYRTGDPSSRGGSSQTVPGTIIYGPQGNITTGITTSPPTDYARMFTGYRGGVGGNGIYFNPDDYVDDDGNTRAYGLSNIEFVLYIQNLGPVGGDDISYLTSNRGNRDSSAGTVRKWYTADQNEVNNDPDLYTTDKDEAFVPFKIEFELSFACTNGGNYRVLYMTKTYEWTTFGSSQDIIFRSGDLATQNNITPSGNRLIFPDYWIYNYQNPRIVYIRAKITNLDTQELNTINMHAVVNKNIDATGNGNFLQFGKYLRDGNIPTGIAPTVVPPRAGDVDVTWSASRSAGDSNTVTYTKSGGGKGPYSITFGPNSSTQTFTIEKGVSYYMSNRTYSGGRGLNYRQSGSQSVQFDDVGDNDFNDLIVSVNEGYFNNNGQWWQNPA